MLMMWPRAARAQSSREPVAQRRRRSTPAIEAGPADKEERQHRAVRAA
jgi:hypothetical protein